MTEKKDWNEEWDMEQSEVDSMITSWLEFRDCDHSWIPAEKVEGALSWIDEICEKCGGAKLNGSLPHDDEPLLSDQEGLGRHCL